MVRVHLDANETVKAESGAMVAASPTVDIESKMEGGFLGALSRKMLSGESFLSDPSSQSRGRRSLVAPTVPAKSCCSGGRRQWYMVQKKDGFLAARTA